MNRIAIFAHYDAANSIQDYVLYYLEQLKKVFSTIIFVSDSDISDTEANKLKNLVNAYIVKRHGEYDFGSYKRGFNYLFENNLLENVEEIAFINDSCYGPLYDLSIVFDVMEKRNVDFWGLASNYSSVKKNKRHVQSYFMILKKNVFINPVFINFLNSVQKENNKKDICIKYELGLTKVLEDAGFTWDVFSNISKNFFEAYLYKFKQLIVIEKFPLLKRNIVLNKEDIIIPLFCVKKLIENYTNFNYNLVMKDYRLNKNDSFNSIKMISILQRFFINIVANVLIYIRRLRKKVI